MVQVVDTLTPALLRLQLQAHGIVEAAVDATMQRAAEIGQGTTAFNNRTGRLRRSIRGGLTEHTLTQVTGAVTAGADDAQPGRGEDWETPSNEYAPLIELGWSRSHPRPFIHPAFIQAVESERRLEYELVRRLAR
mgnify:CR=1 FL=1